MMSSPRFFRILSIPPAITSSGRHSLATLTTVLWVALAVGSTSGFAETPASDPVIAVVGKTEIHQSDLRLAEEDMGKMIVGMDEADKRRFLTTYLYDLTILSKAAQDKGLVDEASLQRRMTYTRNKALMDRMLEVTADSVTDMDVRKFYDDLVRSTKPEPELHIRGILFQFANPNDKSAVAAAEARAKTALERIAKEDFATVAREMTDDKGNQFNGGDLGWQIAAQMPKEFAEVAFTLGKGGVSKPIKSWIGWHIIKVDDERIRKPNEFVDIRETIEAAARRKAQTELVTKLREQTPIERRDDEVKPK